MPAEAVAELRRRTDSRCHAMECSDGGCSLEMSGLPEPNVLIDLESKFANVQFGQTHCDYLFLGGEDNGAGPWFAPIELTIGRKRASRFLRQIEGGVKYAEDLLLKEVPYRFVPIAVGKSDRRRGGVLSEFRKECNRVEFRGRLVHVTVADCGDVLVDHLVD